ncbi:hypothetical protein [Micromonospora sp. NPDC092111]|uniref:hypothetical protein n=1 Tax=Micromonospora sp. NPDC092111 TaxID=3364289 RepID=UPI00381E49F2
MRAGVAAGRLLVGEARVLVRGCPAGGGPAAVALAAAAAPERVATGGMLLVAWVGAVLFLPALALALGVLGRTARLFQVRWLALWYVAVNGVGALDVTGAVRVDGQPAGPAPALVGAATAVLLPVAVAVTGLRQATR